MSRIGRETADDALALAIAEGRTLKAAAEKCGVSERTVRRRWADGVFRNRVVELRADILTASVGFLVSASNAAVAALVSLLKAESEPVRLGAARSILEFGFKGMQNDIGRTLNEILEWALANGYERGDDGRKHQERYHQIAENTTVQPVSRPDAGANDTGRAGSGDLQHSGPLLWPDGSRVLDAAPFPGVT